MALSEVDVSIARRLQASRKTRTEALLNGARPTSQNDHMILRSIERQKQDQERLGSELGRARAFLQRTTPVYACEVAGGPKGKFQVGRRDPMTAEEVIELARSRGWEDAA